MKQSQILSTVFPPLLTEYFEFVDYQESEGRLDYWLDECDYMEREDYKKGSVHPYGFSPAKTIQDFPIRGRSVYLHIRRRKWLDRSTGEIFSYTYDDLSVEGTKLSPGFVAFLKESD